MRQAFFLFILLFFCGGKLAAQQEYPAEVDGVKVERANVEVKNSGEGTSGADAVVKIGEPRIARVTPLGVTFEITLTVNPVKQGGRVERLLFEDVTVNGTAVEIDDYIAPFDLPNKKPLTLNRPVRVYVSATGALANVVGNVRNSQERWPVKGRVYVFGRFKKFLLKFKRVVPVEFDVTIPNPLRREEKEAQNYNNRTLLDIESRYYFQPVKQLYEQSCEEYGASGALDRLSEIMRGAMPEVEKTIQARVTKGEIKDADQARKSVAGNAFQALAGYALIKLQQAGGLPAHLVITLKRGMKAEG